MSSPARQILALLWRELSHAQLSKGDRPGVFLGHGLEYKAALHYMQAKSLGREKRAAVRAGAGRVHDMDATLALGAWTKGGGLLHGVDNQLLARLDAGLPA